MAAALSTGVVLVVVDAGVVVSPVPVVGVGVGDGTAADGVGVGVGLGATVGVGVAVGVGLGATDGDGDGEVDGDGDGVGSAATTGADMATMPTRAITIARPTARMLLLDAKVLPSANHGTRAVAISGSANRRGQRGHALQGSARG